MKKALSPPNAIPIYSNIFRIPFIIFFMIVVFIVVLFGDGTNNVVLHLFYIPIIFSAYYWGIRGSVAVALISGLLAGPIMSLFALIW